MSSLTRLLNRSKVLAARGLTHPRLGEFLARLSRNRVRSHGFMFDVTSDVIHPSIKAKIFWRLYESAEVRFVEKYLSKCRDVVELGGSIGVISCHAKRRIGRVRRLICVEANPSLGGLIKRNLELNGLYENVHVVNRALGYSGEWLPFRVESISTDGRLEAATSASNSVRVEVTSLANLLTEFGVQEYGLICDIEGGEADMLRLDGEALAACRQLIIELHQCESEIGVFTVEHLIDLIVGHGLRLCARDGPVAYFSR